MVSGKYLGDLGDIWGRPSLHVSREFLKVSEKYLVVSGMYPGDSGGPGGLRGVHRSHGNAARLVLTQPYTALHRFTSYTTLHCLKQAYTTLNSLTRLLTQP